MTMDEAVEAGLLVDALRALPELHKEMKAECIDPIEEPSRRWKTMALEFWGKDHADDSSQEHVGPELRLPPAFAFFIVAMVTREIEARLRTLGVDVP